MKKLKVVVLSEEKIGANAAKCGNTTIMCAPNGNVKAVG
jgi:hypothetical protein